MFTHRKQGPEFPFALIPAVLVLLGGAAGTPEGPQWALEECAHTQMVTGGLLVTGPQQVTLTLLALASSAPLG